MTTPSGMGPSDREEPPLVLVVEPNLDMSRLISSTLADHYRVAEADTGSSGFDKARALKPDLILADVEHLRMSANDLVRALLTVNDGDSTPGLLLIALAAEEPEMLLRIEHTHDYLCEPFAPAELRARVKRLLTTKFAHDALLASERRFQTLFEQATDGIVVGDAADGRCVAANGAFCRLLGYPREEICGKSISDLLAEADAPIPARLQDLLASSPPHRAEWSLRRSDSTSVPVEVTVTLLPDGRWQALVRDISERLRTAEALRLSEAKFSGIYAVSADAIISIDESHRITMFNDGARSIFGYSAAEILGAPLDTLIPERFRSVHREHIERFSAGQQTSRHMGTRHGRIYGLRKNGEEFPTDAAISKLDVGGKTLLTVSLRDISEQQRSEDQQRLLAETGEILVTAGSDLQRLQTEIANVIVRNIAEWCAIDIVLTGDARHLKIVHSDAGKAAICSALEQHPVDRQRPNLITKAISAQRSLLVSAPSSSDLESLANSEEHLRLLRAFDPGSFIVVPLIARGHSLGTLAFGSAQASRRYGARDLLEAERLASRVAMAVDNVRLHDALERAIKARDDVLGIVAHDLRNPLNAIVLRAHMLRRRESPERREQSATDSILRSALSMHRLIEDLLDVTRLEAGQELSIHPESVSTTAILAEALDRQQAASMASRRELHLDANEAAPSVWADRTRLLQVFDNLLGNAMKFARTRITVGARVNQGEAVFWVSDDGPGVCAEDLPRLFDRFWQASKSDRSGAGLGLSIVQGIIRAHGGRVWVESEVGSGATFFFTLPLTARPS